jgi:lipoate-protein ligase B
MEIEIYDLGLIGFNMARKFQKQVFAAVKYGYIESGLIFCQHFPVITLGKSAKIVNIKADIAELKERGIELLQTDRGGDVTYHGPGQLTVYPILNLNYFKKDIYWYLRQLEGVAINCLCEFGILAHARPGFTGVWVGNQKIASIGIAIRNWITFHGISINIKNWDLQNFGLIRPCGMDIEMISLETLLRRSISLKDVKNSLVRKLMDLKTSLRIKEAII